MTSTATTVSSTVPDVMTIGKNIGVAYGSRKDLWMDRYVTLSLRSKISREKSLGLFIMLLIYYIATDEVTITLILIGVENAAQWTVG